MAASGGDKDAYSVWMLQLRLQRWPWSRYVPPSPLTSKATQPSIRTIGISRITKQSDSILAFSVEEPCFDTNAAMFEYFGSLYLFYDSLHLQNIVNIRCASPVPTIRSRGATGIRSVIAFSLEFIT